MSTQKNLLELYRKAKTQAKSFEAELSCEDFLSVEGTSFTLIKEQFGNYSSFLEKAEAYYLSKLPQAYRALLSEKTKKFDEDATKEDCIKDLREIQEDNPAMVISRNFYRINGKFSDSVWNRFFGTFHEFKRQAGLELSRAQHSAEKKIAKHASVDHYHEFYKSEVVPFYKKYEKEHLPSKFKRMMIVSDIHDIDADDFALSVFIAECKRKQPDVIVLNGDIFDMYEFSRYNVDIRKVKIVERFSFIHDRLFRPLRTFCPNAQIDFILGNHELRLITHLADKTPNLRVLLSDVMGWTFSKVFGLEEFEINWISKFNLGVWSNKDIKSELKKNHQIYFGCYAVTHEPDAALQRKYSGTNGHHHRAALTSALNDNSSITWVQTPALCGPDADYLNTTPSWNRGFLEVLINTEKKEVIQKIRICHEDWTEIDGILYEGKTGTLYSEGVI